MSELKELSWEVQESVEPVPFEQLEHRGIRRRRRRQTLTGAGVVAAVTIAVAAALLPLGNVTGTEKPPAAGITKPIAVDQAAEKLVAGDARLAEVVFAGPNSWVSSWDGSTGEKQRYAAVLSRDGVRTTTPVRDMWFSALELGDDPAAVSGPKGEGDQKDPSWAHALMVRLTAEGKVEKKLRWAAPTTTFAENETLVFEVTHEHVPWILNPDEGTLRKLEIKGTDNFSGTVQDGTGRWWLTGNQGKASYVLWTDDGGRNWSKALVDSLDSAGGVGVSADGRTAVTFTLGITTGGPVRMKLSTDQGETWTTSAPRERTWTRPPVALNDGSVLLLEKGKLVRLNGEVVATAPKDAVELRGDDDLLYVASGESGSIATSTDLGKTWKTFEPR
ncbi:WD40/YVTN/BNR-like repeat-containing protein [Kribbella sp. CA-294648]|uniref:WD40/YVTN/BNR-like repeat-containing protein n=1 Tax=Kribbella sp. CA-294648 TaxID=3239948 RepID=UPI003D919147